MEKLAIVHLVFPNQYLLASSLMRFQEYYESPKFRGKSFSYEEFMDWYAKQHSDTFTYFDDWAGFNFPYWAADSFTGALGSKENLVYTELRKQEISIGSREFYVIGTTKNNTSLMAHEIVHGLYHVSPNYKARVTALWEKHYKVLEPLRKWLLSVGYHKSVFADEANAYVLTGMPDSVLASYQTSCSAVVNPRTLSSVRRDYKKAFASHHSFSLRKLRDRAWMRKHLRTIDMSSLLKKIKYD